MNWHLIKEDLLLVAITKALRKPYPQALDRADGPFVEFLMRSLRHMVHQVVGEGTRLWPF